MSMSSLSSSAIHLEGASVRGCRGRPEESLNTHILPTHSLNIHDNMMFTRRIVHLNEVMTKYQPEAYVFTRCSEFCDSGHCKTETRVISHQQQRSGLSKVMFSRFNSHCSGHRSGEARSNFSKLSRDDSKSSPVRENHHSNI